MSFQHLSHKRKIKSKVIQNDYAQPKRKTLTFFLVYNNTSAQNNLSR